MSVIIKNAREKRKENFTLGVNGSREIGRIPPLSRNIKIALCMNVEILSNIVTNCKLQNVNLLTTYL